MSLSHRFIRVPDLAKLRLELRVKSDQGFLCQAALFKDGRKHRSWKHQQLISGPRSVTLKTEGGLYELVVDVAFTGSSTVRPKMDLEIWNEDGTQHSITKVLGFRGRRPKHQQGRCEIFMKAAS